MELVPFEFDYNNEDTETPRSVSSRIESEQVKFENSSKPISDIVEGSPVNWSDLKKNYTEKFDELLILSGQVHKLPYFLLLEEAFFLSYTLECLMIYNESDSIISTSECWKQFNGLKKDFPYMYAVYHYYRSKGWVVKSGHQYGGAYGKLYTVINNNLNFVILMYSILFSALQVITYLLSFFICGYG